MNSELTCNSDYIQEKMSVIHSSITTIPANNISYESTTLIPSQEPKIINDMIHVFNTLLKMLNSSIDLMFSISEDIQQLDAGLLSYLTSSTDHLDFEIQSTLPVYQSYEYAYSELENMNNNYEHASMQEIRDQLKDEYGINIDINENQHYYQEYPYSYDNTQPTEDSEIETIDDDNTLSEENTQPNEDSTPPFEETMPPADDNISPTDSTEP